MKNGQIRKLRLAKGWSKEELARQAHVSSQTVRRAETGGSLSEVSREKIARALEVRAEDLFGIMD
jgi:transcriptional regulator with XRE-family HTH domain